VQSFSPAALPTASDWKDLASRFEKQNRDARADWNKTGSGEEIWRICGGEVAALKGLCGLAGAMLVKSPKVSVEFCPDVALREGDPVIRWLAFLKESKIGRMDDMMHAIETSDEGETRIHLVGSMKHLSSVSSTACIYCAAREI
jgi:hypothetical protein